MIIVKTDMNGNEISAEDIQNLILSDSVCRNIISEVISFSENKND